MLLSPLLYRLQLINRMLYRSRQRGFLELDLLMVSWGSWWGATSCLASCGISKMVPPAPTTSLPPCPPAPPGCLTGVGCRACGLSVRCST